MNRLEALAMRRAALLVESEQARQAIRISGGALRSDLSVALLGLSLTRLLARRPWLGALALGVVAILAARRRATRLPGPPLR